MVNQVPGLCENCTFRGLVTWIDRSKDNSLEQVTQFFCKNTTLAQNGAPFILPFFSSETNNPEGNLYHVKSAIVNCTEFVFTASLQLTDINDEVGYGITVFSWFVNKGFGSYNLEIWNFDTQTKLQTVSAVADGAGSLGIPLTPPVGQSRYYLMLTGGAGSPAPSNIFTLNVEETEPYAVTADISYDGTALDFTYIVANSTGVDTLNFYYISGSNTVPVLLGNVTNVPNGTSSQSITVSLANGNYTFWCFLIIEDKTSNLFQTTINIGSI